ncbi:hypothetical protein ABIB62_003481 [Mucilaginibacter sp. UYP25]|uniref:hypothetical protein n=1 Tax=unclassified Mucilaginibacter TaxID=2617802 RepID=UPI003390B37E
MKRLLVILLVFITFAAFGQVNKDTAGAVFIIHDAPIAKSKPLYVIDGRLTKVQPQFKEADLLEVYIVSNKNAVKEYGEKANDGAIIIVTKKWGIETYQKKFAGFSKEYSSYLIANAGDDSRLMYVLSTDGSVLAAKNIDSQRKLYSLPASDIESITFEKESENGLGIKPAIVRINIKAKTKI